MNMREIIYSLPNQIVEAIDLMPKSNIKKKKFDRVLICGMGGSGISGEILGVLYPEIEILTNKDYDIPRFVTPRTLAILVSYSGNTEETLSNYRMLAQRKITMAIISANGKLLKQASPLKIKIPQGLPPRGALGYLFTPLPMVLYKFGLIKHNPERDLRALARFLKKNRTMLERKAKKLSAKFADNLPIIYANSQSFLPAAKRWGTQLNENSKILCHVNIIPEMNHNEIAGLGRPTHLNKKLLLIFLNDPKAHPRNLFRWRILKEIVKDEIHNLIEINPEGTKNIERLFWTIMLGDFISYYLAKKTNINPMPVKRIDYLKKRLAEFP